MSGATVAIEPSSTRRLATELAGVIAHIEAIERNSIRDAVDAQLTVEHAGLRVLLAEAREELGLTRQVLRSLAVAAEHADRWTSFGSTALTDTSRAAANLAGSLHDDIGHRPVDLPDPALLTEHRGEFPFAHLGFLPLFGPLGPTIDASRQGGLADCWLLAGLAALAQVDPSRIRRHIDDRGDGTYAVLLGSRRRGPNWVPVDPEVPFGLRDGESVPLYAGTAIDPGFVLWPTLVEKALAQHLGGDYGKLEGDDVSTAWRALGGSTRRLTLNPLIGFDPSDDEIAATIEGHLDAGLPVTATSDTAFGLSDTHAWIVTGLRRRDGTSYVTVRNPWGRLGLARRADGTIVVDESDDTERDPESDDRDVVAFADDEHGELIGFDLEHDASVELRIDVFSANFRELEMVESWDDD